MDRPFENLTDKELAALDWEHKCSTWPVSAAFHVEDRSDWANHFGPMADESRAIDDEIERRWRAEHDYAQT